MRPLSSGKLAGAGARCVFHRTTLRLTIPPAGARDTSLLSLRILAAYHRKEAGEADGSDFHAQPSPKMLKGKAESAMRTTEGIRKGAIQTVCGVIGWRRIGILPCAHGASLHQKGYPATIVPSLIIDDFDLTRHGGGKAIEQSGGRSIVDMRNLFWGAEDMAAVSGTAFARKTKVHIVAATGFP